MNSLFYLWISLKASLFSTGGHGNVPILHDELVSRGWATDRQFAESMAIGNVAPGPSGLWVISLGYLIHGVPGALIALVAITLPPLLVVWVDRLYRRVQHHSAVEGFVRGLNLAVISVGVVVLIDVFRNTSLDVPSGLIALASVGLGLTRRVPLIAIIALAALTGIALAYL